MLIILDVLYQLSCLPNKNGNLFSFLTTFQPKKVYISIIKKLIIIEFNAIKY